MVDSSGRVRIALVNDYEIVVRGLYQALAGHSGIAVVELDCRDDPLAPADLVLFDSFAPSRDEETEVRRLVALPNVGRVVVFTWELDPERAARALRAGASGYLSKALTGAALAEQLLRIHAGEVLGSTGEPVTDGERDAAGPSWPGRVEGLTSREAEVVGLITQGHTNADIARQLYLSPNSVKSYIRSAYRKIGVSRRAQAVAWGYRHGFDPVLLRQRIHAGGDDA